MSNLTMCLDIERTQSFVAEEGTDEGEPGMAGTGEFSVCWQS